MDKNNDNYTDIYDGKIAALLSKSQRQGFNFNMGDTKYPCVCRRTKLPGRGVHCEMVRGRQQKISQRTSCDKLLTVCSHCSGLDR